MSTHRDFHFLAGFHCIQVSFGDIGKHPDRGMVGDAEGRVAGLEALAVNDVSFENDAVDRRADRERVGHAPVAFDFFDELIGNAEVLETPRGPDDPSWPIVLTRRRESVVAAPSRTLLDQQPRRLV